MTQYYYVIYYDEETNEWYHDCDTESVRFDEGTIWTHDEGWTSGYKGDGEYDDKQEELDYILMDGFKYLEKLTTEKYGDNNGNKN